MKKLPEYYWDSSMFLMVLKGETVHGDGVLDGAVKILRDVEAQKAVIISSQIIETEILPSQIPQEQYDRFEAWLQWPNLHLRAVDHPIAQRAGRLRDKCPRKKPPVKLKTPDAIHVATALVYQEEIHAIHSVDDDFQKALKHGDESMTATRPVLEQLNMEAGLLTDSDTQQIEPESAAELEDMDE